MRTFLALCVFCFPDFPVEVNFILDIDALYFPGIAITQPEVRNFDLMSILDYLFEDAIVVADAISPSRVVKSSH